MFAERIKIVELKGNKFKYLDFVAQPFVETIGFSVFPDVSNASRQCCMVKVEECTSSTLEVAYYRIHSVRSSCWTE